MKKILITIIAMLLPLMACADAVEIDGFWYNLISKGNVAELVNNPKKYSGAISIPSKVVYEEVEYSVTSIGENAFSRCNITSVTIPNSVTFIGNYAFFDCTNLKSVHISDLTAWCKIMFSTSDSNPLFHAHHLFIDGNEIINLVIPNNVTKIENLAFYGCSNIISVTIPQSINTIGNSAFFGCTSLSSVTIPNSVNSIGSNAFSGCSNLESVILPNNLASIDNGLFDNCSNLVSVTIPQSVNTIGNSAFQNCTGLTSMTIPQSVTNIGAAAFKNCIGINSITIPDEVTNIGNSAFEGCSALTSIVLGEKISSIGFAVLSNCPDLANVYCFAKKVPSTKPDAFNGSYIQYATLHVPTACVDDYKATMPWIGFKDVVALDGEVKKCAIPTIMVEGGIVSFNSETEGATYVASYNFNNETVKKGESQLVLTGNTICHVSVYATKEGYLNSPTATADVELNVGVMGDVDGDGKVNVADHVSLSNIIFNINK